MKEKTNVVKRNKPKLVIKTDGTCANTFILLDGKPVGPVVDFSLNGSVKHNKLEFTLTYFEKHGEKHEPTTETIF